MDFIEVRSKLRFIPYEFGLEGGSIFACPDIRRSSAVLLVDGKAGHDLPVNTKNIEKEMVRVECE